MRILPLLATLAGVASGVAQSPLSLPFNANNGLGTNSAIFFDLAVTAPAGITLTALDVNTSSTAGAVGTVEVWTTPTTHVGAATNPGLWTLGASGGVISAGSNNPSPVCLGNGGLFLPFGNHGVCVRHVNVAIRYTDGATSVATAELGFTSGQSAGATTPFSGTPIANRIFNGNLYYNVGSVPGAPCPPFATKVTFGTGCYPPTADSWYENFSSGLSGANAFDFAGAPGTEQVLLATSLGPVGSLVLPGASAWFTPASAPVLNNATTPGAMTDDAMSGPRTLPFVFPFPGGSTSVIHIAANGFVQLGATTTTTSDYTATVAEALGQAPRLFALWCDLHPAINLPTNPQSGIYYDVDPSNQVVYVTWLGVADRRGGAPAAGATAVNVQVALHASGNVEYRYGTIVPRAGATAPVFVGISKGNGSGPASIDPGNRDLSAVMPFVTDGPDSAPLALDSNTPRFGTNWTVTTSRIHPSSPLAITFVGSARVDPGLDLGFLGAPGCSVYINTILGDLTGPNTNGSATMSWPIPNNPSLGGLVIAAQSVCLSPRNALGLNTSNGLEVVLGL